MSFLVILGLLFGGLFLTVFLTKRRLGVLGLSLAAGYILASLWVSGLTPVVAGAGIEIIRPPLSSVVATMVTLLPVLLVFFSGASAKGRIVRFVSAGVFALLAIAFLLEPLGTGLVIDDSGRPVYEFLAYNRASIITIGLGLALLDLLVGKKLGHQRDARH